METINVRVNKKIYENDDGTFFIYVAEKKDYTELTIKVNQPLRVDGNYKIVGFSGIYQEKPTFQVSYIDVDRNSYDSKMNLLCSIDGIKEKTAELILSQYTGDLNEFKNDNPPKIKGIGPGKIVLIKEGLELFDQMEIKKELSLMLGNKITIKNLNNIAEKIENEEITLESFKTNPYEVLIEQLEISFLKADKIAQSMGVPKNADARIIFLAEYLAKKITLQGNCYCCYSRLVEELEKLQITKNNPQKLIDKNERLVIEESGDGTKKVYLRNCFEAEVSVPKLFRNILKKTTTKYNKISNLIFEYESASNIKFDEIQKKAIESAINNNIIVITGGAGCGKTTLLKCIIYCLDIYGYAINGIAPTGKASRRFHSATGLKTSTMHSYIIKSKNHYPHSNGCMIIDEFSMVDVILCCDTLKAMEESSINYKKLIIVGDYNQLASVQAGNCLYDIIQSDTIKVVRLEKTYRQCEHSNITSIANNIVKGITFDPIKKRDFYVQYLQEIEDYKKCCIYFYKRIFSKYSNLDAFFNEVQFIAPLKKGPIGTIELNKLIKNEFNPTKEINFIFPYGKENPIKIFTEEKNGKKVKIGKSKDGKIIPNFENYIFPFDIHDKIMNLKNDNLEEVYNGEIGRITSIDDKTFTVFYSDINRSITYKKEFNDVNNFQLAYVATIHKLQGCEFKYCAIFIQQDSMIADRRLLYTAITRGKETVLLFTNKTITNSIVKRQTLTARDTFLQQRLKKEFIK
jgi:exodeoxyribonuclease V alpha subunit